MPCGQMKAGGVTKIFRAERIIRITCAGSARDGWNVLLPRSLFEELEATLRIDTVHVLL